MYSLKPGASMEEFKKWSREIDQRLVLAQPGVYSFEVYEIKGIDKGEIPFQVVEEVGVDSYKTWQTIVEKEEMKNNAPEWEKHGGDPATIKIVYGDKI